MARQVRSGRVLLRLLAVAEVGKHRQAPEVAPVVVQLPQAQPSQLLADPMGNPD